MPIPTNDNLTPGDWYQITAVDESGGSASLSVGTEVQATALRAGAVDPVNVGGAWQADYNGAYHTRITGLEFLRHAGGIGED